jgi:hypothetical protein
LYRENPIASRLNRGLAGSYAQEASMTEGLLKESFQLGLENKQQLFWQPETAFTQAKNVKIANINQQNSLIKI